VLRALLSGADGVMITGCHPGECHYIEQNYKALRRYLLLRRVLQGLGIEPERVKLVWASAAEGARFASETNLFVEEVRKLGPLNWGKDHGALTVDSERSIVVGLPSEKEVPA
jgi:F420-non-reducing hydrogenase iron-sulfur subunit